MIIIILFDTWARIYNNKGDHKKTLTKLKYITCKQLTKMLKLGNKRKRKDKQMKKIYIYKGVDLILTASNEKVFLTRKEALDYYNSMGVTSTKTYVDIIIAVELPDDYADWKHIQILDEYDRNQELNGYDILQEITDYQVIRNRFS